ncbi:glycine oxidase ThiO [Bacillus sp. 03113]|uniref:glycine oxidase ThiO n=1 Tax=Bacillus sp. 03113 TaxID=2578211 RepID=UPI0011443FC0|nr:glycine oxidase ThiO [Bacillus sp. 03113]
MKTHYDVAVIGGGIIGCSIAYHLAKEKVKVAVFDSGQIGSKATSAAAGMLGAHSEWDELETFYPFARSSQLSYFQLKDELQALTGIDIGLKTGGIYKLAFTKKDQEDCMKLSEFDTVQWLSADDVRKEEESISEHILGAAYLKDDVSVIPSKTCMAFSKGAGLLGADIQEHTPVHQITKHRDCYQVQTAKGTVMAEFVVIASGVWSTHFFQQLDIAQKLVPVKGECLAVYNDRFSLHHTLFHDQCYIVPRNNGKLVIGATMVENDWTEANTMDGLGRLFTRAVSMLPAIKQLKIESFWSGLRPQTFDQKPFIGAHPDDDHLFFATGHYRNGILLAPGTGDIISRLILKKQINKSWLEAFKIDRSHDFSTSLRR